MSETMRAVVMDGYGGVEVLRLAELPRPSPGPGEVLIAVHAASVNPFDTKVRRGFLSYFYSPPMPHVLGADYAGVVEQTGEGVDSLSRGDRVWGVTIAVRPGSYAEFIVLPAAIVRRMPERLGFAEAASVPMGAMTAWYALHTLGRIREGQRVLVHAGAGGVGGYAIQIARAAGAEVFATCGAANMELVRSLGAQRAIDYRAEDFASVLSDIDLAVDPLGGETNLRTYRVIRRGGTILVVLRGDRTEMENRERLSAEYGVQVRVVEYENEPDILDRLRPLFENGTLRPTLTGTRPLAEAADAHTLIETGHARGKIVLQIR